MLGLAFKPRADDIADAPAVDIIEMLISEGSIVGVYDPAAMENACSVRTDSVIYAPDLHAAVSGANATLLLTEWPEFINADWESIKSCMATPYIVLNGRNTLARTKMVKIGSRHMGIGRHT